MKCDMCRKGTGSCAEGAERCAEGKIWKCSKVGGGSKVWKWKLRCKVLEEHFHQEGRTSSFKSINSLPILGCSKFCGASFSAAVALV